MPIRDELEREGLIRVFKEGNLNRITAAAKPDMSQFTKDELQIIDHWIEYIDKEHTAQSISDKSPDYCWDIAAMNEELPFYAVLAERVREPSAEDLERLKKKARAHGLF
jgi:hypothetical protein